MASTSPSRCVVAGLGGLAVLALGCAHDPSPIAERARARYESAAQDGTVREFAGVELYEAKQALERLQQVDGRDSEKVELEHRAYIAEQRIEIARLAAETGVLESEARTLTETGDRARLEAREQETQVAEARAEAAEAAVDEAQEQAHASELDAADARAMSAEERALSAEDELREIKELNAEKTERGLVLTLTSGLFAVDRAELQPGALPELDRVATFLSERPGSEVIVEGHTDDEGDAQYNLSLSERRARAVADHLASRGIDRSRIRSEGLGEAQPIAPNDTPAGRQQNRRVEVVITR